MTQPTTFDLLTIGHSNLSAERFLTLLQQAGVGLIADVRSVPFSRRFPWFSGKALAEALARDTISYLPFGDTLGGRPREGSLYCEGIADYGAMAARPDFRGGLDRVIDEARGRCLCLMCAEREPLDCHRCLLVARALAEPGLRLGHILSDGAIEPHAATEDRLLALTHKTGADLFEDGGARLADAYRRRARAVAARVKP